MSLLDPLLENNHATAAAASMNDETNGLRRAALVVQDLWTQLAERDSPAVNETKTFPTNTASTTGTARMEEKEIPARESCCQPSVPNATTNAFVATTTASRDDDGEKESMATLQQSQPQQQQPLPLSLYSLPGLVPTFSSVTLESQGSSSSTTGSPTNTDNTRTNTSNAASNNTSSSIRMVSSIQHHHEESIRKMGHGALVDLCAQTLHCPADHGVALDSGAPPTASSSSSFVAAAAAAAAAAVVSKDEPVSTITHHPNNTTANVCLPLAGAATANQHDDTGKGNSSNIGWRGEGRRWSTRQKATATTRDSFALPHDTTGSCLPPLDGACSEDEKKQDDVDTQEQQQQQQQLPCLEPLNETAIASFAVAAAVSEYTSTTTRTTEDPQRRWQQFGSEYARHLSTSPLAPTVTNTTTPFVLSSSSSSRSSSSHLLHPSSQRRPPHTHQRRRNGRVASSLSMGVRSRQQGRTLHDAPAHVQSGALLDIVVTLDYLPNNNTSSDDVASPAGYYRLAHTASGHLLNKNGLLFQGGGGKKSSNNNGWSYHIHVKKESTWDKAAQRPCVTSLALIFPDRQEFVPPGFSVVRLIPGCSHQHGRTTKNNGGFLESEQQPHVPVNWNAAVGGTGGTGERVYLCMRRSREGNPLTGLLPLVPAYGECVPPGYTVLERTPRNHTASITLCHTSDGHSNNSSGHNTTSNSSGSPIVMFWAYRQRLANLETLRPAPLLQSLVGIAPCDGANKLPALIRGGCSLRAYYATGGTVVASDIGRFHILDRTTHSLLSPSSVANRLQVLEMARCKDTTGNNSDSVAERSRSGSYHSTTTYARSECDSVASSVGSCSRGRPGLDVPTMIREHHRHPSGAATSDCDDSDGGTLTALPPENQQCANLTANLSSLLAPAGDVFNHSAPDDESVKDELSRAVDAVMSFIPRIETATSDGNAMGKERLQARIALFTPIVTACYTRHGGAALLAVEGLYSLLSETDFFADDVDWADIHSVADPEQVRSSPVSTRITLLDLAVQVVCDVATTGAQEIMFAVCVNFVERSVAYAQGHLNSRTIGYVVRFHMFVFYFDASIPRLSAPKFPPSSWRPLSMQDEVDFPMLCDPRAENGMQCSGDYLPGGAPQAAALALKELISFLIIRLGQTTVEDFLNTEPNSAASERGQRTMYTPLLDSILSSVVDNAVDFVDRANYTQLAIHQIYRSGGSELFWHDMTYVCGGGLFAKDRNLGAEEKEVCAVIFALLQQLVKLSSGKLRPNSEQPILLSKDVASKLLSLELLLHFLEFWSDEQEAMGGVATGNGTDLTIRSIDAMAFAVRRTVVPCLLWNTRAALDNPQVFRRIIRIVSELWCSPVYRKHCKVELGVLIEHFALRLIELGPMCSLQRDGQDERRDNLPLQQVELIREIINWFSNDPKDILELYLNYDTDIASETVGQTLQMPGKRWMIFQRLSAGLCSIAEQCGEHIGDQIRINQSATFSRADKKLSETKRASAASRDAARVLRKVSLDAIAQIVKDLAISAGAALGDDFKILLLSWSHSVSSSAAHTTDSFMTNRSRSSDDGKCTIKEKSRKDLTKEGGQEVLQFWRNAIVDKKRVRTAAAVPSTIESLETAFSIAKEKNVKKAIEYLIACNSITPSPRDIANFLRVHKDRFDPIALGQYLGGNGTGGSESEYWSMIRYLFVRAISFIGMDVEQSLRHFLTSSGFRLPGEAQQIDRILSTFAQCFFEDNSGDSCICPFKNQDTVYLLVFAIIMLNTDLHKAESTSRKSVKRMTKTDFINNFKCALQGDVVSKEYLSVVYDSIEVDPIAMQETHTTEAEDVSKTRSHVAILNNVRPSESLLRGLAVHDFKFATVPDAAETLLCTVTDALFDLTCSCVSKTWHQWYGVVNTCLETAHLDPQGIEPAVDILLYALVVSVCLDMPMERSAFLSQLLRLRAFEECRQGRWVSAPDNSHREEQWYVQLEMACSGLKEQKLWALRNIHSWVTSLKCALQVDVQSKIEMTVAVSELIDGSYLLNDPARTFLQSEELVKRSSRTGRSTTYRFYLFSDLLLYASKVTNGQYRIHEELPLHLMKIVDWFPPWQKNRYVIFDVHHPNKTFQVLCDSTDSRNSWVENIRASILVELNRKMTTEAARLSASIAKAN